MILGSGLLTSGVPAFGTLAADSSDSTLFSGYAPNVAVAGPVSRRLYFGKSGGTWRTLWTDTSGALLRGDEAGTHAVTLASDGPEPFDTDDGLATDTHNGSVAAGTTFIHEADMLLEFTATTVPSAGNASIVFRAFDASNYWQVSVFSSGVFSLFEVVAGGYVSRASTGSGTVGNGHRVVVIAEGTTIRGYSDNVLRWTYASATNFATATAGDVFSLGTGGVASDLKTWPRTLSGTAASILDKVSA